MDNPAQTHNPEHDTQAGSPLILTGGGWIHTPPDAFHPDLSRFRQIQGVESDGHATFGFVSRFLQGTGALTGSTEFRAGEMSFRSTQHDWMVVKGARGQYKGLGRINSWPETYAFILTCIDGSRIGKGDYPDRLRIKIWDDCSGTVIYDNQPGSDNSADLYYPTIIGGGNVLIYQSPPPAPRTLQQGGASDHSCS